MNQGNLRNNAWQLLGQSKLAVRSASGELTDTWLSEILEPLRMPPDVFNTLKASVRETVARFLTSSDSTNMTLIFYISRDAASHSSHHKHWGFFKLEKTMPPPVEKARPEHIMEYYLYLEG